MRIVLILVFLFPALLSAQKIEKPFAIGTSLLTYIYDGPNIDIAVDLHEHILINANVGLKLKSNFSGGTNIGGIDEYNVKGNSQRLGIYGKQRLGISATELILGAHIIRSLRHEEMVVRIANEYWGPRIETNNSSNLDYGGMFDFGAYFRPKIPLVIKFTFGFAISEYSIEDSPIKQFYSFYKPGIGYLFRFNRLNDADEGTTVRWIPKVNLVLSYRFGAKGK